MATALDEVISVIENDLNLGKVNAATRSGSSGWAAMHRLTTDSGLRLFVKVSRENVAMFEGEGAGLTAMYETGTIRIPKVYHYGALKDMSGSFIIMELLELGPAFSQKELGEKLAEMHLAEPLMPEAKAGMFGFSMDNTIGSTPQPNGWMSDWVEFFRERRLRHQVLLTNDSELIDKGNRLCLKLDGLFEDIRDDIKPSLLHGDLWSGNVSSVAEGPVIYDPACYYGHHEAEFGMSWCLGDSSGFWDGYRSIIPKAKGFNQRLKLYQLYHYLNHYNLFGGGYWGMSNSLLTDLLSSLE